MKRGNIIFLNGVSSSGKTTLAKVLQDRLSEPFFLLSPDTLVPALLTLPDKFKSIYNNYDWFQLMLKSYSAYHRIIGMISDMGLNTIVDTVLLDHIPLKEFLKNLFKGLMSASNYFTIIQYYLFM